MPSRRELLRRAAVAIAVTTAIGAGALVWSSTLLGEYSVMEMGDGGGGHGSHGMTGGGGHGASAATVRGGVSVTSLIADPDRPADVSVELVARQQRIDIPGGNAVEGYTVNGTSPGPEIRARQGDLIEVEFVNASVTNGATLHWHGIDVPNADDGVAGITQDAVPVGARHVYRFVATDAGTYWYHSHQVSHEQVEGGLLGAIVIEPAAGRRRRRNPQRRPAPRTRDVTALLHVYDGQHTLNGRVGDEHVAATPGSTVRVRVINTDQGTTSVWSAARFRVLATDGHEVNRPTAIEDQRVLIPAGGRADVEVRAPERGADPAARRGRSEHPRRRCVGGGIRSADAPAVADPRSARLRRPRAARLRPHRARPLVRVRDRPPLRLHRWLAGQLLDHQRPHVPRRADVPRGRTGRRRDAPAQRFG